MANERDERENASVSRVSSDASSNEQQNGQNQETSGSDQKSEKRDKKSRRSKEKSSSKQTSESKGSGVHDDEDKKKDDKSSGVSSGKMADVERKRSLLQRLHQIHMAAQAATAATRFIIMFKFLNMMKMLLQMAAAILQTAAQSAIALLVMFGQAVVNLAVNAVVAIAGFLGSSIATAVTILVTGIVSVALVIGAAVGALINNASVKDDIYECNTDRSFMRGGELAATEEELATAKTVYAVLKAYGLPDTNIAGVLGNWSHESNIDPTGVETIYTEPRLIPVEGTRKGELWYGSYEYTYADPYTLQPVTTEVSPANFLLSESNEFGKYGLRNYTGSILSRTALQNYSDKYPAIHYMGIGLGQWTNGRNSKLRAYADAHDGFEWYDLELQLMFMIDPNGDDELYVNRLASWAEEPTASSAAEWFCEKWEGITCQEERKTSAEGWYSKILTWQEGVDYDLTAAESLINSVLSAGRVGSNLSGAGSLRSCSGYIMEANDSAAACALLFAWGPGEAYNNDGTECWQQIFNAIVGDEYIRCCDRTVACAIKWSGTDSDYPNGSTQDQLVYLLSSPRWQKIDWGGDPDKLLPGDVLIRNDSIINIADGYSVGHTLMYVGVDNVVNRFGETYNGINVRDRGYCFVSGSINTYSPHVQVFTNTPGSNDLPTYYAFRNVEKFSNRDDWTSLSCVSATAP